MKWTLVTLLVLLSCSGILVAADKETLSFSAYVDSDLCSHLMLGPINESRIQCSQKTYKDGSNAVLVRLKDSLILQVNKEKMINKMVGTLAKASGQVNFSDGTMKLESAEAIAPGTLPAAEPGRMYLDVRNTTATAPIAEKIRHTLAMMPYLTYYDFISFNMVGSTVFLNGWTVRPLNRSEAYNRIKAVEGVTTIINNLEVLPVSMMDNQIRASCLARLQPNLGMYFWGSGSNIKIVVKNGDIILLGQVNNSGDKDIANIQANQVAQAFHVFNMLTVNDPDPKKKKEASDQDKDKKKHGW